MRFGRKTKGKEKEKQVKEQRLVCIMSALVYYHGVEFKVEGGGVCKILLHTKGGDIK